MRTLRTLRLQLCQLVIEELEMRLGEYDVGQALMAGLAGDIARFVVADHVRFLVV